MKTGSMRLLGGIALLAGCQGTLVPGPGATPPPGVVPSALPTPDRLASCEAGFQRYDEDKDGRWRVVEATRWLYERPLVPTFGPCAVPGRTPPSPGRVVSQVGSGTAEPQCALPPDPATILARLDRDGDGALSPAEACTLGYEQLACDARFTSADRDKDGAVSLDELRATRAPQPDSPAVGANPAPPEVVFRALDANGDGRLDKGELCGFQRVTFAVPTAAHLTGNWAFGTAGEPPAGPLFGECPPGSSLRLTQQGTRVTGEEMVCGGPCFTPTTLEGTYRDGTLALTGTVPAPAEGAGRPVTYALRFEAATGHLTGTRDGKPYWATPHVRVEGLGAPCPL